MKKAFIMLMLATSGIMGNLYAQDLSGNGNRPFYVPENEIKDSFHIQLDKGNSLQIELTYLDDLKTLIHTDSIIKKFRKDIHTLEDSLSDPLSIKKIIYLTDTSGKTYIHLQQRSPKGKNYLITGDVRAAMKTVQDTVKIIKIIPKGMTASSDRQVLPYKRYVVMTFYLNNFDQLFAYENKHLGHTLAKLYDAARTQTRWSSRKNLKMSLAGNYSLADALANKKASVHPRSYGTDYLTLHLSAGLQNVYHNLAPSGKVGVGFGFPVKKDVVHELQLSWEPMFLFQKDKDNVLKTYRNDWLVASYSIYSLKKKMAFSGTFSLGYLIRRKGDFFEKNSFMLGLGGLSFSQNKITLQPVMYFHDLFKGVTPGLRLSVGL